MTLSITTAEPGARLRGPQRGIWAQEKHLQSGALPFACTEPVVTVVASKCQPLLPLTSDRPEPPLGSSARSKSGRQGCSARPCHHGAWDQSARHEPQTPLPPQPGTAQAGANESPFPA